MSNITTDDLKAAQKYFANKTGTVAGKPRMTLDDLIWFLILRPDKADGGGDGSN